jgi:hypothetical protein
MMRAGPVEVSGGGTGMSRRGRPVGPTLTPFLYVTTRVSPL